MDSGKSTLLGVLIQGELDDGRGKAKLNLFHHLYETESDWTSTISYAILGFSGDGKVIIRMKHIYIYIYSYISMIYCVCTGCELRCSWKYRRDLYIM